MTTVLVHGGGFGASCWDPLLPHVDGPVLAVDLPGRGRRLADLRTVTLDDFAAAVVDDIVGADLHDVLLVGHSMAGITLPRVAEAIPERLRRLVFVSCTVPAEGESILDTLAPGMVVDRVEEPGVLDPDTATALFGNDMTPDQLELMLGLLVPEAVGVIHEPCRLAGLAHGIPCTWVRLLRDLILPVARQDEFITNLCAATVVDLDAAHMAMISTPSALAAILNGL